METFIRTCGIQEKYRVSFLACRIYTLHFEKSKPYLEKSFPNFVRELRRIYCGPDLTQARLTKFSAMSQDGDEDPLDFMERIRQLTAKVIQTMSIEDRVKMAATRFLSGMSDRVMAQQLLAAGVTDTVQHVDRTSAMSAAAGRGEHSRSRKKKDVQWDDFNIIACSRNHCFCSSKERVEVNSPTESRTLMTNKPQISSTCSAISDKGHKSESKALRLML